MRTLSMVFAVLIFTVAPAPALDLSTGTSTGKNVGLEGTNAVKSHYDKRTTVSTRITTTRTSGGDHSEGNTERLAGQATSGGGVDITMPAALVFLDLLAELETQDQSNNGCKPITAPLFAGHFGISSEIDDGLFDPIKAAVLQKAGTSASRMSSIGADEPAIRQYIACLSWYGSTVGQATLNLNADLASLKSSVRKGKDGAIEVQGMGFDDFIMMAKAALVKVSLEGVTNPTLKSLQARAAQGNAPCRFAGRQDIIQCGPAALNLTEQSLSIGGIKFYGQGQFGGTHATYKLNRSWSLLASLENAKQDNRYSRWSKDVAKTVDKQVSKGQGSDAVRTLKTAARKDTSSKQGIGVGKVTPPLQ